MLTFSSERNANRGVKIVFGITIVLLMTSLFILLLCLRSIRQSLPQVKGSIKINDLRSSVRVYRDTYGVPHLYANNEDDLYYALGYVTAQDRLWQMDILRRTASGKLSEIYGKSMLNTDILFLTIGLYATSEKMIHNLSTESQNLYAHYAAGINAYITSHSNRLPLEFSLLNYKPELWKIEDCVAIQRFFAWRQSLGWHYDLLFGALINKLGYKKVSEIFPEYLSPDAASLQSSAISWTELCYRFSQLPEEINQFLPFDLGGSSWVVSGKRSITGRPLLACDSHLRLTHPSTWYEIHIVAPFIDAYGVSLPGFPGIIIGHNTAIAWGLTNLMVDNLDFFIEQMNPHNTNEYLFNTSWLKVDTTIEIIMIKNQAPETLTVRHTKHGPIISHVHDDLEAPYQTVAMKWTGHENSDELFAFHSLLKANNWQKFSESIRGMKIPGWNFVYADTSNNIGYAAAAAIPIRRAGRGEVPFPGWTSNYDWHSYLSTDKLPRRLNPPEELIVMTNDRITDDRYPYFISNYWESRYRTARIKELLSKKDKLSLNDFKLFLTDCHCKHAEALVPLLKESLKNIQPVDELESYFYDILNNWRFDHLSNEVGATIFQMFLVHFIDNTFKDEMGDTLYQQFLYLPDLPLRSLDKIIALRNASWFDDQNTPQLEKMHDIIIKSLNDAYNSLHQQFGGLIDDWRWGKLHAVLLEHPLGERKPLNIIFNIDSFPFSGNNCTVHYSAYQFSNPFEPLIVSAARQLVDLSNVNNSLSVITTGQSGQPLDPHYKDQFSLWCNGMYHQALMDYSIIESSDFDLLILEP